MRLALFASMLLAAPALGQGPATPLSQYEEARGAPFGEPATYTWEIRLDDEEAEPSDFAVSLGPDWARWTGPQGAGTLIDLAAARFVTIATPDADDELPRVTNSSLFAEARRRIDIYAGLSQGGTRTQISFGAAGTFDRVWLEAAMGLAAQPGVLEIGQEGDALIASYEGERIAQAWFAMGEDSPCETAPAQATEPMLAMLRHSAPLHPDLISAFRQIGLAPCALTFTVLSPDSPNGRMERWVLQTAQAGPPPLPDDAELVLPQAALIGEAGIAAVDATRQDSVTPDGPAEFHEFMLAMRDDDDLAGAFLMTVQETHNFGPCPQQIIGSARLGCGEVNALVQAGLGDADFERALEGVTAVREAEHAVAVNQLSRFIEREDRAGAAARIMVANELVAWGAEGLQTRPDLDPAALLTEALLIDPAAPDVYWLLGRRFLEAGAPHAAWVFFDLGRSIPGREPTPLLEQADLLESRLSALAPDLAPARNRESAD